MRRTGLLLCLMTLPFSAALAETVADDEGDRLGEKPLELELELAADDWLLEGRYMGARTADTQPERPAISRPMRGGDGFKVRAILPALCEDHLADLPLVNTYNSMRDCEADNIGVSVSISNY